MADINEVILLGRLGADPILKTTNNGTSVAELTLATSKQKKNPQTGAWEQSGTQWHKVVVWGKAAEAMAQTGVKGSRVFVKGEIEYESWEDRNTGEKKWRTRVNARAAYVAAH